jgi:hypothetical protein
MNESLPSYNNTTHQTPFEIQEARNLFMPQSKQQEVSHVYIHFIDTEVGHVTALEQRWYVVATDLLTTANQSEVSL